MAQPKHDVHVRWEQTYVNSQTPLPIVDHLQTTRHSLGLGQGLAAAACRRLAEGIGW